ncbi:unnamed protein product [Owenia fusiformis]|uniref:MACPF domain-containing protein n=1 Tax=Owenia fusiformis TaxID=6347 RepID=A0A8S4NHJ7_OWEFU|nr:unnamed protein product [Owenia fusiformis]
MAPLIAVFISAAIACAASALEPLPDRETLTKWLDDIDNAAASSKVACQLIPPGLLKLRQGFELGYLDQLPLTIGRDDGTRRTALDFSCNENKKWLNPYNGVNYDKPDQIANIVSLPRGILEFNSYLWKDYNEIKRTWSDHVELEIIPGIFGFSASYSALHHKITAEKKFVEDVTSFVSAFRAELKPSWQIQLNSGARQYIDTILPNTYEANMEAWDRFVEFYGTHYYAQGSYGGLLKMTMETDKEFVLETSAESTKANAEATFKNWLIELGVRTSRAQIDAKFTENTNITRRYFGGSGVLTDPKFYEKWVPTVHTNPWMFAGQLQPLSVLFPQAKVAGMDRAIQVSLNKAGLNEMKAAINAYITDLQELYWRGDWEGCGSGAQPDRQCRIFDIVFVQVGCICTGCKWFHWKARRDQYIAEAQAFLPLIVAEERKKGRDDRSISRLYSRVGAVLQKMDTKAVMVNKEVWSSTTNCHCSQGRCTCRGSNIPAALVRAPEPFFNNWPYNS